MNYFCEGYQSFAKDGISYGDGIIKNYYCRSWGNYHPLTHVFRTLHYSHFFWTGEFNEFHHPIDTQTFEVTQGAFWGKADCGLILSSISPWELKLKESCVTKGGWVCKAKDSGARAAGPCGATRFVQLIGKHKGDMVNDVFFSFGMFHVFQAIWHANEGGRVTSP